MGFLSHPILEREEFLPCNTLTGWAGFRVDVSLADDPLGEYDQVLKLVANADGQGSATYTFGADQDLSGIQGFALDMFVDKPVDTTSTSLLDYDSMRILNGAGSTSMLVYDRPPSSGISPFQGRHGHQYRYLPMGMQVDSGPHNIAATRLARIAFPVVSSVPTTVYIRKIYRDDLFRPAYGFRIDDVRDTGLTWAEDNILEHYGTKYPLSLAVAGSLTGTAGLASLSRLQDHVAAGTAICFNHTYAHNNLGNSDAATILADYENGRDYLDENGLTTTIHGIKSSQILVLPFGSCDALVRQVLADTDCVLIVGVNAIGSNHRRHIVGNNLNAAGELGVLDRQLAIGTGYTTTAAHIVGNIKACADAGEQALLTVHDIGSGGTAQATAVLAMEAWSHVSRRLRAGEADWITPMDWALAVQEAA